jgi:hypothetical protein
MNWNLYPIAPSSRWNCAIVLSSSFFFQCHLPPAEVDCLEAGVNLLDRLVRTQQARRNHDSSESDSDRGNWDKNQPVSQILKSIGSHAGSEAGASSFLT